MESDQDGAAASSFRGFLACSSSVRRPWRTHRHTLGRLFIYSSLEQPAILQEQLKNISGGATSGLAASSVRKKDGS